MHNSLPMALPPTCFCLFVAIGVFRMQIQKLFTQKNMYNQVHMYVCGVCMCYLYTHDNFKY